MYYFLMYLTHFCQSIVELSINFTSVFMMYDYVNIYIILSITYVNEFLTRCSIIVVISSDLQAKQSDWSLHLSIKRSVPV